MGIPSKELQTSVILYKNDTIGGGTFFVDSHPMCLSHLRREGYVNQYCSRVAGYDTDHLYEGRCKFHAVFTERTAVSNGRYAEITSHQLNRNLQRIEEDPDIFNMTPELKLLRAMLMMYVEKNTMEMNEGNIRTTRELIKDITHLISTISSIQERHVLTVSAARLMMLRAIEIAKDYVPEDRLKSFVQEWKQNTLPVGNKPSFEDQLIDVPVSAKKVKIYQESK